MYFCHEIRRKGENITKAGHVYLCGRATADRRALTQGFDVSGPKDVCGAGREAVESDAELPQSHTAVCPEVSVPLERHKRP